MKANTHTWRPQRPQRPRPATPTPVAPHAPQEKIQTQEVKGAFQSLIPSLQRSVAAEGYVTPTPVQEQCIPHVLAGRDVQGCAQTGTGKTAAFALPILQTLAGSPRRMPKGTPRVLILAPTRELAAQIGESVRTYGRHLNISHTVIFGGVKQLQQERALNRGADILVATPGRLLDLVGQGIVHLEKVEVFVLDEVDRMLDMGFIHDIKKVLARIPKSRQTLFFSATFPPAIMTLADTMVKEPIRVTITPDAPAVERIKQKVLYVGKRNKDVLLVSLLGGDAITKAIVFTQMKHVANRVVKKLAASGIDGAAIHGNKSQGARTKALDGFKRGTFRVLVATDVAARGLDVDDISHVINYDLPMEAETYVHRIGRTARAGASGNAISFCCAEDRACLRDIEKLLGAPVPAELEHAYHCDDALRSTRPAPKPGGGGRGRSDAGRATPRSANPARRRKPRPTGQRRRSTAGRSA